MGIFGGLFEQNQPQQEEGQPPLDQAPPQDFNVMPRPSNPLSATYYEKVQIDAFEMEIEEIRGMLEGKIKNMVDGKAKWEYPTEELYDANGRARIGESGKPLRRRIIKPFCNADGQREILAFLSARLKSGTPLSNYTPQSMLARTLHDAEEFRLLIYLNRPYWKVDSARWEAFHFTIIDRIEAARRRAVFNKEREGTGATMSFSTIQTTNDQGRPPVGFLGNLGQIGKPKSKF